MNKKSKQLEESKKKVLSKLEIANAAKNKITVSTVLSQELRTGSLAQKRATTAFRKVNSSYMQNIEAKSSTDAPLATNEQVNIDTNTLQISEPIEAGKAVEKMAEIAINAGLAKYSPVVSKKQHLKLSVSANTLVIKEAHQHVKELVSVISALASSLTQVKMDKAKDAKELLELNSFKSLPADHVLLLHQFVSRRDEFLNSYTFCDAKTIARTIGIRVNNLSRKMQQMREAGEILFVKMGDSYLYPEFQLDRQGNVFSALSYALPMLYEAGRTGWDICFWLFTEHSILLERGLRPNKLKGKSFEDLTNEGKQLKAQTVYHKGIPIENLRNKSVDFFAAQLEEWVAPDNRDLNVRMKALG